MRRLFHITVTISVTSLLVMLLFAKRGVFDWKRMNERNQELSKQLGELRVQKHQLEKQIHDFQSDPLHQETIVRKVLGYVRPLETVIEFD